jgi:para-nitrobenzyl esterase
MFLVILVLGVSRMHGGVHASLGDAVRVQSGLIAGVTDPVSGVTSFKGIPFAAPPVASLRWREPMPVPSWNGVRIAKEFARPCMQPLRPTPAAGMAEAAFNENLRMVGPVSEDCLYLNVWTAANTSRERRPVIVWVPGGGFVGGSPAFAATDGTELARRGVVVVSISYRLGVLGFFSHPELSRESPHHASGNYGFLDQLAALRWVRANISAFGGDPRNVTIFGQSAGATMSVQALMASPLSRGLFHRVIAMSGSMFPGLDLLPVVVPAPQPKSERLIDAKQRGRRFAESVAASSIAALRAWPAEDLVRSALADGHNFSVATMDGWFLPEDVPSLFKAGKQNDVPLLVGWDANEGDPFAPAAFTVDALDQYARRTFGQRRDAFAQFILRRVTPKRVDRMPPWFATYHERNHQGVGNALIAGINHQPTGRRIRCRSRLGGLLNYYERAA